MATKKRAAKKAGVKAGAKTRRAQAARADEVEHSPIIITDGSASVEFQRRGYTHVGSGSHPSLGRRLVRVEARRVPNGTIDHVCRTFTGTTRHRIVAHCMVGEVPSDIIIEGANQGALGSNSPEIDFRRDIHFRELANFPPKFGTGVRFTNADARIVSFTVTNLSTGEVHDCPLGKAGGFEYTIVDGHN